MTLLQDNHYTDGTMNDYTPIITGTASGSIASFSDGIGGRPFKSIVFEIEPNQSGSGDPSPTNIRPITGCTQATVTRTGKNVFYVPSATYTRVGVTYTYDADTNTLTKSGTSTGNAGQNIGSFTVPAGTYTFSAVFTETGMSTKLFLRDAATNSNCGYIDSSTTSRSFELNGTYYLRVATNAGETGGTISKMQLELGSTATTYEPYQGISITIPFGDTIYGGTVDVVNGVLTLSKAYKLLNDADKWISYSGTVNYCYMDIIDRKYNEDSYVGLSCTIAPVIVGANYSARWVGVTSGNFGITDRASTPVTSLEAIKSMATAGQIAICYDIEPITIDLTPQQITTLLGDNKINNIWANTGDITVEYWIEFWLNTRTTLLQDIHYTDNNFWTDLLNCWNTKNYVRAVRLLEENQELTSKYVNADWFNLLTNNIYYLETQQFDPSFKNDKIQVGYDLPTDILIGTVFFMVI